MESVVNATMTENSSTKRPFNEVVNATEVVDVENESPAKKHRLEQEQKHQDAVTVTSIAARSPTVQPEQTKRGAVIKSPKSKKKTWTKEEDEKLRGLVQAEANKEPKWTVLAKSMGIRTGKQCRERWTQHLRPGLVKGKWTAQEDALVAELQEIHGNKWSKIAESLPHRTDNDIKNRWNSKKKQERNRARLLAQGISFSAKKRGKKTRRYTKKQAKPTLQLAAGKQHAMSSFAMGMVEHSRTMMPSSVVLGSATRVAQTPPDVLSFILGESSIEYKLPSLSSLETPPTPLATPQFVFSPSRISLSPYQTPQFVFSPSSISSSPYRNLENFTCSPLSPWSPCFVPATLLTPPAIQFQKFACSPIGQV